MILRNLSSRQEAGMLYILVWLTLGGLVGWLASIVMRTNAQQNIPMDISIGVLGAFVVGLVHAEGSINRTITAGSVLWSLLGAIALLAAVNLVRKGRIR
jgi:uncharacterized membrane protein YeaQ/YmgE (transglycosylase-associated protein family)